MSFHIHLKIFKTYLAFMNKELIILGCGYSLGVPRIDGHWGKCDKNNKKNIRTRCAAAIIKGSNVILIDASVFNLLSNKFFNSVSVFTFLSSTPPSPILSLF